eukprot:TRINITY_DN39559_c0_g1_i1.p1 TRINITY_DN39559_c0_g1~~TRINITY_DN39559_c0_g1_i1.p1  ORF type:complete len:584 (+),score=82.36 TRINITY_DN39559_c0_g1_i1:29-1753(+)
MAEHAAAKAKTRVAAVVKPRVQAASSEAWTASRSSTLEVPQAATATAVSQPASLAKVRPRPTSAIRPISASEPDSPRTPKVQAAVAVVASATVKASPARVVANKSASQLATIPSANTTATDSFFSLPSRPGSSPEPDMESSSIHRPLSRPTSAHRPSKNSQQSVSFEGVEAAGTEAIANAATPARAALPTDLAEALAQLQVLRGENERLRATLQQERESFDQERTSLKAEKTSLEKEVSILRKEKKMDGISEDGTDSLHLSEVSRPPTANSKESRPMTVGSGRSYETAASQASLIYSTSPSSLRSIAEWVFPLQSRSLPPERPYERQLLANNDPRRQWIEEYIQGSLHSHRVAYDSDEWCTPPQIEVVRVSEVINPLTNTAYTQQLAHMQEVWITDREPVPELARAIPIRTSWQGKRMNEVLLFHGCSWDALFGILREGFDPRLGGTNTGAAFGIGSYFTTVASKADGYTEKWGDWQRRPSCDIPMDLRCLLVARVALGEVHELRTADSSLRRPPTGPDDVRCDSVLGVPRGRGGCVDYDEFVIYKQSQATPQFIVDYKHMDNCNCRACRNSKS